MSLQAWRFLIKLYQSDTQEIKYDFPIDFLGAKIPMLSTTTLHALGIKHIQDLITGQTPKSAEQIMAEHQLPNILEFSCICISHFLRAHPIPKLKLKIPTKAWHFYSTTPHSAKGISIFYNLIHNKLPLGSGKKT